MKGVQNQATTMFNNNCTAHTMEDRAIAVFAWLIVRTYVVSMYDYYYEKWIAPPMQFKIFSQITFMRKHITLFSMLRARIPLKSL